MPGTRSALASEYVVLSAHLDHIGVGAPVGGDSINNGAMDNASGVPIGNIAANLNLDMFLPIIPLRIARGYGVGESELSGQLERVAKEMGLRSVQFHQAGGAGVVSERRLGTGFNRESNDYRKEDSSFRGFAHEPGAAAAAR